MRRSSRAPLVAVIVIALVLSACSSTTTSSSGAGGTTTGTNTTGTVAGDAASPLPLGSPTTWSTVKASDGRTFLTDASHRALQLRGFNIKTRDPAKDASDDLLAAGQVRGFNLLRLSIYWDQFEPTEGAYDEAYLSQVDTVIHRAAAHGIYVVLDFHQDVFGAKFGDHGVPIWATHDDGLPFEHQDVWLLNYLQPAVQAAWEHLYEDPDLRTAQAQAWAKVATRYKDSPGLLGYDLLNEPFGKVRPGEDVAQAAERMQRTQLTDMYQRLSDVIHSFDREHWILFEPPNVASLGVPVALGPIKGDKLIYFPHFYDAQIESATYSLGDETAGFDPAFFTKYRNAIKDYPVANGYPMMWGEWGIAHPEKPGMDAFVAQSIALMDELGSGWTMFNWCRGESYCPLDKDGRDRPAIGQIVQPYARATAGVPTTFGFDPTSSTLKVVFAAGTVVATGSTDIVIPATSYPAGFAVATSRPDGTWTSTTDAATPTTPAVVHVTTPLGPTTTAICITPKTAPAPNPCTT